MTNDSKRISDQITLLVFKDHFVSRTFEISITWLHRLTLLISLLVLFAFVSAGLAIKYFILYSSSRPSDTQILQSPAPPLLGSSSNLPVQDINSTPAPTLQSKNSTETGGISPQEMGTPSVTSVDAFSSSSQSETSLHPVALTPGDFSDAPELAISIQDPKLKWKNRTLQIRSAFQYIKTDQGNQTGRFLLLARGPGLLFSYPTGGFNEPGSASLLKPQSGEYFSVSRYRELKADFGPFDSLDALEYLELYIFTHDGKPLAYRKYPIHPKDIPHEHSTQDSVTHSPEETPTPQTPPES
ncbi:MAG: hypothetical protein ACO3A2_00765 [Bdellovibrionia bacterium]